MDLALTPPTDPAACVLVTQTSGDPRYGDVIVAGPGVGNADERAEAFTRRHRALAPQPAPGEAED